MNPFQQQSEDFCNRHIGPNETETKSMLSTLEVKSVEDLIDQTIPAAIRFSKDIEGQSPESEYEYLHRIKELSKKNLHYKTYIGQGYYNTITPAVILRNVFENPGWYTAYTPYQAEISQGRLESLLNFQTMISEMTGLSLANASLLDEATAAAEAMLMFFHHVQRGNKNKKRFFVDDQVLPQTLDVLQTRAISQGIELVVGNFSSALLNDSFFGALLQYPDSRGAIKDYRGFIANIHNIGGYVAMAADLMALTLLTPPGELGADVAIGNTQRFGVPMGYGGPHAGYFSTHDNFKREIPGRLVGISEDSQHKRALRLALQTREQHIKREKATSNICTAQALPANMAAMYAVWHGPEGLKRIGARIALLSETLSESLRTLGYVNENEFYFDTLEIKADAEKIRQIALIHHINFFYPDNNHVRISLDETTTQSDVLEIVYVFSELYQQDKAEVTFNTDKEAKDLTSIPSFAKRTTPFLGQTVFNQFHSETQLMRYLKLLEDRDISLNRSMIPLGSCTMKLNAAAVMLPASWSELEELHPFLPLQQVEGYQALISELEKSLCLITGMQGCSMQPNSGAQGEYTGLTTIMRYHQSQGKSDRNIVLIPVSAHGTNPASAVMAGMEVITVGSTTDGAIDVEDLKAKAELYSNRLGALMVTYPSTNGVFEERIREICDIIHMCGGQVYMDGANMNAQVGLTSPGQIGADVCHLNLHKTFAIPHGGGGPGVGPICVKEHLTPYLPDHVFLAGKDKSDNFERQGAVVSSPYGSAGILVISHAYISMMGIKGLKKATQYAILNANYMKKRLSPYYPIVFTGQNGNCAHEFMIDIRQIKEQTGIGAEDIAKRLMDFGFHAPTLSFPVHETMMIEPTESEDKQQMDELCDALIEIRKEINLIEEGKIDPTDNPLKNAPHTQQMVTSENWVHPYSRKTAAYPLPFVEEHKFWPFVSRINNGFGDRHLCCTCGN